MNEQASRAQKKGKKPFKGLQKRTRRLAVQRWTRYGIQLVFFILAPGLFSGAFNGVKYLFSQIGSIEGIEATSFVVLLVMALAFTVLFGRFFCGYACAFGTLGDYLFHVGEFLRSKTPLKRWEFPERLVRVLSYLKYAVLAAICIACVAGVWGTVSKYSPWVAFAGFTSGSLGDISWVAFLLLGLVVLGMFLRERFFCQFLCPMGAVFSLLPVLPFSDFTRRKAHCARSCGRCRQNCPVGIWPDADMLEHGECISCGRCAGLCPMNNVNLIAIEKALAAGKGAIVGAGDANAKNASARGTNKPRSLQATGESTAVAGADASVKYAGASANASANASGNDSVNVARATRPLRVTGEHTATAEDASGSYDPSASANVDTSGSDNASIGGDVSANGTKAPRDFQTTERDAAAVAGAGSKSAGANGSDNTSARVSTSAKRAPANAGNVDKPRPLVKRRDAWYLLQGVEPWLVLGKAAALLALCWVVGATRYIPAFAEVFGQVPWALGG